MFRLESSIEAVGLQNLQDRLPDVEPYLFNLADQLIGAAPEANWNLMIGDDTSGRLPTFFIRQVLKKSGYEIQTRFIAGSKVLHNQLGAEKYQGYFKHMVRGLGQSSTRALIMTESITTSKTAEFLTAGLSPIVDTLDTATVMVAPESNFEPSFAGSRGKDARYNVYFTFESVAFASLPSRTLMKARKHIPNFIKDLTPKRVKAVGLHPANELLGMYMPDGAD